MYMLKISTFYQLLRGALAAPHFSWRIKKECSENTPEKNIRVTVILSQLVLPT